MYASCSFLEKVQFLTGRPTPCGRAVPNFPRVKPACKTHPLGSRYTQMKASRGAYHPEHIQGNPKLSQGYAPLAMTLQTCSTIGARIRMLENCCVFVDNYLKSYNHSPIHVPPIHKKRTYST